MANENIERIGVETVVIGLDKFTAGMKSYNDSLQSAIKTTTQAPIPFDNLGSAVSKVTQVTSKATTPLGALGNVIKGMASKVASSIPGFQSLAPAIQALSGAALGTIAVVAALGVAIAVLGKRGAEVRGVETAFRNITTPILDAGQSVQDFANELRIASGDTIAQFELMRLTNLALAGTTGELSREFGQALPELLQIARVQATATGQSVEFLFDSLVRGVKRGSKLIIDNTGLVLDTTAANQTYAESIGKTVDQLTEQEKTIALLNATIAAGNIAITAAGGIQETAATKLARAMALIQNTIDAIAVGVEPLFGLILDAVNFVLSGIESVASFIGPILRDIARGIGAAFGFIVNIIGSILKPIADTIQYIGTLFANARPWIIQGAASVIIAIADAFLWAANTFVLPTVVGIAELIADFLSGFSPPPKGPLSTIDTGGANVMLAWLGGFTGAFTLDPVKDVANEVNQTLGNIATMGIDQVEKRLKQLDLAIRPFQERVKILEDQFNAIRDPAEAAIRVIDEQISKATEALLQGDTAAANLIRQLNIQKETIQDNLDLNQQRVDMAKVQLALAGAQQQKERTLLEIQKARLDSIEKAEKAVGKGKSKGKKPGAGKEPKPVGGGAAPITEPGAGMGGITAPAPETPSFLGEAVDFFGDIGSAVGVGLEGSAQFQQFQAGIGDLQGSFARIKESNPVQAIAAAFKGLPETLGGIVEDALKWFADPKFEGGFANFFSKLISDPIGTLGDIVTGITNWLTPLGTSIGTIIGGIIGWFSDTTDPSTLAGFFTFLISDFGEALGISGLLETISLWFTDNLVTPVSELIGRMTGNDPSDPFSIPGKFFALLESIAIAIGNPLIVIQNVFAGLSNWISGQTEGGGLPGMLQGLIDWFATLPTRIFEALRSIGLTFWNVFVKPIIQGLNWVIDKFNDFFSTMSGAITDALIFLGLLPEGSEIFKVQINRISEAAPAFLNPQMPGAKLAGQTGGANTFTGAHASAIAGGQHGGLFGAGMLNVGERGREMVSSAQPFAVFSNQFVRAIDMFSQIMMNQMVYGGSVPIPASSIANSSTDNRSITVNANTQRGVKPGDIAQAVAMSRAFNG